MLLQELVRQLEHVALPIGAHGTAVPVTGSRKIRRCLSFTAPMTLSETRLLMVRFSAGVYGVMKTRRGHSSSFMAMEPRVTLEVRTSCRTWLGLGVAVRVRSAWRRAPPAKRMYYMPLLLCRTCTSVAFISAIIVMT